MHHLPYIANIAILIPVVYWMLRVRDGAPVAVFGNVADAPSLRIMLGCLWSGLLLGSCIALVDPLRFWPLLAFQVFYKALFIALYCLPIWLGRKTGVIPRAMVAAFALIVVVWPFFIVMALRAGQAYSVSEIT